MKLSIVVAVVVLVLQIRSSVTTLTVLDGDLANTTIITAQLFKKGDDFSIFFEPFSGELVLDNATSVDGKIVYLVLIPNSFYTTVKELQSKGAIGILTADSGIIPGRLYCTYNNEDFLNEILIPIAQANTADLDPILTLMRNGGSINITISSEGNQWADVFNCV